MPYATALEVFLVVFSVYVAAKFAAFFVVGYPKRRAALDRAYAGKTSATKAQDPFLLAVVVALVGVLLVRGMESASFLTGLLAGAIVIQVYFHRFSTPLREEEAPPAPVSPIKTMSYAIQAAPGRAWVELVIFAVLVVFSVSEVVRAHGVIATRSLG